MIRHPYAHLLLAAFAMLPASASGQEAPRLDPSVASVVTGGYWERSDERGHYRIIVWTGGFEHVLSRLRVEWIVEDPGKRETRVVVSSAVDSIPDWTWSLGQPNLRCSTRGCEFTIQGTEPHVLDRASWVVSLSGPGQMSVRMSAVKRQ